MNKIILILLSLFTSLAASSEEMYFPELMNLFESDLVVDASYMRADGNNYFIIRINEVIKGEQYSLSKGNYLRLKQLKHDGCGGPINHSDYKRRRYYLKKKPTEWTIHHRTMQSIRPINEFAGLINEIDYYPIDNMVPTMNEEIKEFLNCYRYNEITGEFEVQVTEQELEKLAKENIMVFRFEKSNRLYLEYEIVEPEPDMVTVKKDKEILDCSLSATPAESPFSEAEMRDFLLNNENPLSDQGIEGRSYIECIIDTTGTAIDIKFVRGLHPILDSLVVEKVRSMPKWTSAKNSQGIKEACSTKLPFSFKIDESPQ